MKFICPHCKTERERDATYCLNCGRPLPSVRGIVWNLVLAVISIIGIIALLYFFFG